MSDRFQYQELANDVPNKSSSCCGWLDCLFPVSESESKEVERIVKRQSTTPAFKLLLLGAGDCGKSTFLKQIRLIHKNGYTDQELLQFKEVIYNNTLYSVRQLIHAAKKMNLEYEKEENLEFANKILEIPESQFFMSAPETIKTMSDQIANLWKDGGIQQAYEFRSNFNLLDSAAYYLSQVDVLAKPGYKPTEADIVRSRQKTVGIVEISFTIEGSSFMLYDVGGQRNERKKWIHAFEDVTAVIFVASLSEYDQKTIEDEKQNRMIESLLLFDESINSRFLRHIPTILFLNKFDIFQEKIKKSNLNICFSDYKGGYNEKAALDFIKERFREANQNKNREIYIHTTQATDKENVRVVFEAVKNIVLRKHLKEYNLL